MRRAWMILLAGCAESGLLDPSQAERERTADRDRRIERYIAALTDASPTVRDEAFRGLAAMSGTAREPLVLTALYGDPGRSAAALQVLEVRREAGVPRQLLRRWPRVHSSSNRASIADFLGRVGDQTVVADLACRLAEEPVAVVRVRLCRALGLLGGAHGIDALAGATQDPVPMVSLEAIRALGRTGKGEGIDPLLQAWRRYRDDLRRSECASGLGQLRARAAVLDLIEGLSDPAASVREAAASALGRIGDTRAVRRLVDVLGDPAVEVFHAAEEALREITGLTAVPEPGPPETLRERTKRAWERLLP